MSNTKKSIIIIGLLVFLNIILKSFFLGVDNLDIDEPFTIYYAQANLSDLLHMLKTENNPPIFYLLLHYWIKLFGISALSSRFLPMLFSSFAVIFIYLIGNKFYDKFVAIGASILYTFSNLNIEESHDTRVYSLFVMLSVISMYYFILMTRSEKNGKYIAGLTITNIFLVLSHLFGWFVVGLEAIYILFIPQIRTRNIRKFVVSFSILFIVYLPYLIFIFNRIINTIKEGRPFETTKISNLLSGLWSFTNYDTKLLLLFLGILFTYIIISIIIRAKPSKYDLIILGWFVIPYILMYLISIKIAIAAPKYLIYITPGLYLSIMVAIYHLFNSLFVKLFRNKINGKLLQYAGYVLMFTCIFKMISSSNLKASNYSGSVEAVSIVKLHKSDSTFVFLAPPWISLSFSYYYNQAYFKDFGNVTKHLSDENIREIQSALSIDTLNTSMASDVLYVGGEANGLNFIDPDGKLLNSFVKKFGTAEVIGKFSGYTVYHFNHVVNK